MYTHGFRAMNTQFHIWLDAQAPEAKQALQRAEAFVRHVEALVSRFRPDSVLSRVNRAPGQWHTVPPLVAALIREALHWARVTQGWFDPTVLPALQAVGYTCSFDQLPARGTVICNPPGERAHTGGWQGIQLEGERLYIPPGTGLDLGGIAKEWVADRLAEQLAVWGPCLVDAGGDIRAVGKPALWGTWPVGVAHPLADDVDVVRLGLHDAGLATSSRTRRRWRVGSQEMHHLINPHTGQPAQTRVLSASVVAPTAVMAGIGSKLALMCQTTQADVLKVVQPQGVILVFEDGYIDFWWEENRVAASTYPNHTPNTAV